MREITSTRRQFGYRRIELMLACEGITMNQKKRRRLHKEEGLAEKHRWGRKRATGTREPRPIPDGPSKRWSLDFVSDVFGPVRRFCMLNVIDDYTRGCLALVVDTSLSGPRAVRELDHCIRLYGKPEKIVSDKGTKLTSRAILEWLDHTDIACSITRQAYRSRAASSKALMASYAIDVSMKKCSTAWLMPEGSSVRWWYDYNRRRPHSS